MQLFPKPTDSTVDTVTDVVVASKMGDHDCSTGYEINLPNGSDRLLTQQHKRAVGPEVPRLDPGIQGERRAQDVDEGTKLEKYGLVPSPG